MAQVCDLFGLTLEHHWVPIPWHQADKKKRVSDLTDPINVDLFQTKAWFKLLLAHGFEQAPHAVHVLQLPALAGDSQACLHLMQRFPGSPLVALSNYYSCLYGPESTLPKPNDTPISGRSEPIEVHQLPSKKSLPVGVELSDAACKQPDACTALGVDWTAAVHAVRRLPGSAVLRLQPLDASAPWVGAFEESLRLAGYRTSRFFAFGNWYQPVPVDGFSAYWRQRPSALRNSTERGHRRLSKAGDWKIDLVQEPGIKLDAALAAYQRVYAQSWKQAEPCPDFIPSLATLAAQSGWLRLGVLWLNGEPLAAQLWLTCGNKANIYKLAYVKGVEKLSVGSVLTQAMMQHAMDIDRVTEVDYLSGDDAYKADWMALRRERVGLEAFDMRRTRGLMAACRHTTATWWRKLVTP